MKKFNFNHIPKCGGTALSDYLIGADIDSDLILINGIKDLIQENFNFNKSIYGHMDHSFASHFDDGRMLFSLVRDPKKRIISLINHSMRDPSFFGDSASSLTFDELIANQKFLMASKNIMTKLFSGNRRYLDLLNHQISFKEFNGAYEDDIDLAISNVDDYDFIGTYEDFIGSIRVFCEMINIYPPKYLPKLNNQLPDAAIDNIDENLNTFLNDKDQTLYNYIREKFKVKEVTYFPQKFNVDSLNIDFSFFDLGPGFIGSGWYSSEIKANQDQYGNKYGRWAGAIQNLVVPQQEKYSWLILEIKAFKFFDLNNVKLMSNGEKVNFTISRTNCFDYLLINLDAFSGAVDLDVICCDVPVASDNRSLSFFLINMLISTDSIKTKLDDFINKDQDSSPFLQGAI